MLMKGVEELKRAARRVRGKVAHRLRKWLGKREPYRPHLWTTDKWNAEYARGRWDYLAQIEELSRYALIAGYCHFFEHARRILDLGCGEGVLHRYLRPDAYDQYLGIDISAEAIERAKQRENGKTSFLQADVNAYLPDDRFDLIVFNEVLYYLEEPVQVIENYKGVLSDRGVLIAAMYDSDTSDQAWRLLDKAYTADDEVKVSQKSGYSGKIKVYSV